MVVIPLGPGFGAEPHSLADITLKADVVTWDNRATMHRDRPSHEARLMIRTTISATEADGVTAMRPPSWQAAE